MPLTFFSWIFSYLLYWFENYVKINVEKGNKIVSVSNKNLKDNSEVIYVTEKDIELSLTPYGKSLDYEEIQIPQLTAQWLMLFHMSYLIRNYKLKTQILNKVLLMSRILCWIYISHLLFY